MLIDPAVSLGAATPPERPVWVTVPTPMFTDSLGSGWVSSTTAVRVRVAVRGCWAPRLLPVKVTLAVPLLRPEQLMPTPLQAKV